MQAEDELRRCGHWCRVLPCDGMGDRYLPLFEFPRYRNTILAKWMASQAHATLPAPLSSLLRLVPRILPYFGPRQTSLLSSSVPGLGAARASPRREYRRATWRIDLTQAGSRKRLPHHHTVVGARDGSGDTPESCRSPPSAEGKHRSRVRLCLRRTHQRGGAAKWDAVHTRSRCTWPSGGAAGRGRRVHPHPQRERRSEGRRRAHEPGRIHAQNNYLRYAYATIDAIAPDAQTSSRAV